MRSTQVDPWVDSDGELLIIKVSHLLQLSMLITLGLQLNVLHWHVDCVLLVWCIVWLLMCPSHL